MITRQINFIDTISISLLADIVLDDLQLSFAKYERNDNTNSNTAIKWQNNGYNSNEAIK